MSYRGPDATRIYTQMNDPFRYAGQTATWRQYISSSAGVGVAGMGTTYYYREQTITAIFGQPLIQGERQTPGGQLITGAFNITTREPLQARDEVTWNGVTYRVAGQAAHSPMGALWVTPIVRGSG